MIPRRLQLHNFLSYRDCTLDFTGLHMVVLSGKNGDGKSALLDAMTWALWGEARGKRNDERIHLDQDEMSVDFEFEVDRDRFAIVRKRTRGKGTGELHLFQVDDTGIRKVMTGGVMSETQADINRAVRMEYETFVNSAFIAQGRSNEFTRRTPADRKQVFRKLLGLERYEVLAKAAREEQKRVQGAAKELASLLDEARTEVQKLPEVEAELAANACARKELQPRAEAVAREEAALRASVARQDQTERAAHDAQELVAKAEAELERGARELQSLRDALAGAELLIAAGTDVEARYDELKALRAEESRLGKLQAQAHAEQKVIADAEHEVDLERQRLQGQAETARAEVTKAEKAAEELPGLEASLAECAARRATFAELRTQAAAALEQRHELAGAAAAAKATADALKAEGHQVKARRDELAAAGATCPVCLQPLTPDQVELVRDEYTATLADLGKRYRAADAEAATAADGANKAATLATRHETQAQTLEKEIAQQELALHSRVEAARVAMAQHDRLTNLLQEMAAILETEEFAGAARERAADARKMLATLGYDAAEYATLRGRLGLLAGADEAFQDLQQAHTRAEGLRSHIAGDERALGDREEQLRGHRSALDKARTELEGLVDARPRLERAECELAALREQLEQLIGQHGRLAERRDTLLATQVRIAEEADRGKALAEEDAVYGELWKAFGRDGVQAMLIQQSLPRVEWIANEMLNRMTGGRIQVQLMTVVEGGQGTAQDTLAIRISDDLGTRDYEMYSGGEAFRVDFALRIALAKLLAERSGASLPTLIIDEGFGTQDEEGIQRLVETLGLIKDEFQLILVVTHLDRLKSEFERRIDVTKDPIRGSMARVI